MTEPILKDPRELYHTGKFADQDQDTPALQDKMLPKPDCGEESYVGNHLLENHRVLITGGDSGIGRTAAIALRTNSAAVKTAGISATVTQMLGISEPALFGVVMRTGMKAIGVMLASSALGGMALSLLGIQANSYGLAVLLSPLMYIYDPYQLTMYVVIGIATFILAFVLTNVLVMGNETIVTKVKIQH